MLDEIDALIMLERFGTVSEAAVRLRLTQSAVSKRIQSLQNTVGFPMVEPDGRRIRLTARGAEFLERARPLVAELRGIAKSGGGTVAGVFSLALGDSIASSWGPGVVRHAISGEGAVRVELHAHRSVLVVESVRLGRYQIGLCTDQAVTDLIRYPVVEEPMVLIHTGFGERPDSKAALIAIEPGSATWRAVEAGLRRSHPRLLARPVFPVESFPATVQMVKAGFGDGLAPLGMAMEMGLDRRCYRKLAGVRRPVAMLARKTVHHLPGFQEFRERLTKAAREYFAAR